jgi:tetratricopeptide (TPR) repeat protein
MPNPTVFISYSHDSPEHADRILELSNRLRADGIDCMIDQYETSPAEGWPKWMDRQIAHSDFVLVVCTETYHRRVMDEEEKGKGLGVKWESTITYQDIYDADSKNTKFIPVLFGEGKTDFIPKPLKGASYYFLMDQYEGLYRHLTDQPKVKKPILGSIRTFVETAKVPDALPALERKTDFFAPDWFLAHPYAMPPNFTGRRAERNMLTGWLNADKDHPLLIIRALGGFGKSALTWYWLTHDVDAKQYPAVVFWSFYEGDASFDNFLKETLKYLGVLNADQMHPHQQTEILLNLLRNPGLLLILDGFERVLRAYGSMGAAYQGDELQKDKDDPQDASRDCINLFADAFLKGIGSFGFLMRSKILMTTRLTPRAVEKRGQLLQGVREEELKAMNKEDAVAFFRAQGIRGTHAEIEAACEPYGYHPLSLRILSGWILNNRSTPGDIAAARNLELTQDIIQNKHHILEVGFNSLSPSQQKLLGRIACFRAAMTYEALKTLHGDGRGNLAFDESLKTLESRGLLHWDRKTNKYDLHPIVRRFAYDRLAAADRRGAHQRLVNYFEAVPKIEKIQTLEDLAPVIELYHHMVRAGKLDEALVLFRDRLTNALYFQLGAYQIIVELLQALFLDGEDKPPRLKEEVWQGWTLNTLANAYAMSGQPHRAVQVFETIISIDEKNNDKSSDAAITLGNVASMAQLPIGALKDAERNLRRRIDLCREIEDEDNEAIGHEELGHLLSYRGAWHEAEQEFSAALNLFNKQSNDIGQAVVWQYRAILGLLMLRDDTISKLKLKSQIPKALELLDKWSRANYPVEREYVIDYWLLGAENRIKNKLGEAEENLSKALSMCRQINDVMEEADILLYLARLRYDQNNYEEARSLAEEALTITERCGYVLQGADVNLFLAQYALEQGQDKAKANEYAQTALKLATCDDGPPYHYKVAYEEAQRLLEKLK